MRFRLKSLRAGLGPLSAEVEVGQADRQILHPLFVVLRDEPALLRQPRGAEDREAILESVGTARSELTNTLKELGPDSDVSHALEILRQACREFVDVASNPLQDSDFVDAIADLRIAFREIAAHVDAVYGLLPASQLASAIETALEDRSSLPGGTSLPKELPERAASSTKPTPLTSEGTATDTTDPVTDVLVDALEDSDENVRFEAFTALGDRLKPELLPVVEKRLNDPDPYIRRYAIEYYARLRR